MSGKLWEKSIQWAAFPFSRVLVMDSVYVSAVALCSLADDVAGFPCSYRVMTLSALRTHLNFSLAAGERVLVITELMSSSEPLSEGFRFLDTVNTERLDDQYQVMVCTDLSEPLLLSAVVDRAPDMVVHRRESLDVIVQSMSLACAGQSGTTLSPLISDRMEKAKGIRLTQRELEWLITQKDRPGVADSARRMQISYKTAATYRQRISQRLNIHIRELDLWLARL